MSDSIERFKPLEGMMPAFYKAVLNQNYKGQDIKNILYYRTAVDTASGLFGFGGAAEVAEEINQEIVPKYRAMMPPDWSMQSIDVYPYNNLFELVYQLPYTLPVNVNGQWTNFGTTNGPAPCVNIKFNLEPTVIGSQALLAPKRGYVAISPISDQWIGDDGYLIDDVFTGVVGDLNDLADALSSNLESIDPPAVFFPIRAKVVMSAPGEGGATVIASAFADISSAAVNRRMSFRRSRLPEA